jgi:nucleotide-binding universal stress UspA family protein
MSSPINSDLRVVVGVDRPENCLPSLGWAFAEAGRRVTSLDVIHAWIPPHDVSPLGIPNPPIDTAPFDAQAKRLLDDAIARVPVGFRHAVHELHLIAVQDRPSKALLDASSTADLLVVGSRGRGALSGLLGSVSHQCVHHATCAVAVIPPNWPPERTPARIVVGVDGSTGSAGALRWALDEAERWASAVTVVHSWYTPYPVEPWGMAVTPRDRKIFETGARTLIGDMVDLAVADGALRPKSLTVMSIEDASGPALVHASADTDLLVVGSRGRGGFAALLVGSTSLYCLHHAPCPVVIVPATT